MPRLTPLGCAGWMPHHNWQTMSFTLEYNDRLFLLDAGSGIANLKQLSDTIQKYKSIHLLLSHFHLDHIIGFFFMNGVFNNQELHVYGPGKALYKSSTEKIISQFNTPPYSPVPPQRFPFPVHFHDYELGVNEVDGVPVYMEKQKHSNPSCSIRIGDLLTYVTDTACTDATIEHARGSRVLMHECWWDRRDYDFLTADTDNEFKSLHGHSHAPGVAEIARKSQVERLLLVHYNPAYSPSRIEEMADSVRSRFPRAEVLHDMQPVLL
ncbi:hypothetical protein H8D51_02605 [bacterium]|nr:hypothetical protein [bacterium]